MMGEKLKSGFDYNYHCPKCRKICSFTLYKGDRMPTITVTQLQDNPKIYSDVIFCDCGAKMTRTVHKQGPLEFREL